MDGTPKIILLCGNRRSGRSSMILELLRETDIPIYGFMTRTLNTRSDGYHEIYMFPYGQEELFPSEACHIGDCNTRQRVIHDEVFNTLGVELVSGDASGILVMDELGFMEARAEAFCAAVLSKLRGDGHILAAVRTSIDTPFLQQVLATEGARVVQMDPERFNAIRDELVPIIRRWKGAD